MTQLLDDYQQYADAHCSEISWLSARQKKAMRQLQQQGFPKRRDEDWKYSAPDALLQQPYAPVTGAAALSATQKTCFSSSSYLIEISHGQVRGIEALASRLPEGMIVQPLAEALRLHEAKVKPYLGQIMQDVHGFQALNTAMLQLGLFVYLPENECLDKPLQIIHWQDTPNKAMYLRHVIVAAPGSRMSVIEAYQGADAVPYLTNTATEIVAESAAHITHYKIQTEGQAAYHVGHLAVCQQADSRVETHAFQVGGQWVRSDISIQLQQPGANCLLNGIYQVRDKQHVDQHTSVYHQVPNCTSEQDYKGLLSGHARAVFNGKVVVAPGAQHTEAKQQNKNLLLSKNAEIDTKPQLEIFADDVSCTHGATVGQLDDDALFYFATRGIAANEARQFLIKAFIMQNIQHVTQFDLAHALEDLFNQPIG